MNLRQFPLGAIVMALTMISAPTPSEAQDTTIKNKHDAELLIPRPGRESVKSLNGRTDAMDTLDTADPFIKILLFPDYTWKYWKDPSYARDSKVFNEYWTHERPDPYGVGLSELPNEIALWIVDTLSSYRCPHIGNPSSRFGYRHRRRHQGVDVPLQTGTPVYAAFDGKVRISKYHSGYGNLVVIRHDNGLETFYAHLSKIYVENDQWVDAGSIIGLGGSTGRSTGPHLHFETRYKGYAFDPEWLIDFPSGNLRHRLFVLKKKYLNAGSKYVPESEQEEIDIIEGDEQDRQEEIRKAEEAKKAAAAAKAKREAASRQYYTIRKGDTLGSIARRHHTTVRNLCRLNGISEKTILRPGRKLRVR